MAKFSFEDPAAHLTLVISVMMSVMVTMMLMTIPGVLGSEKKEADDENLLQCRQHRPPCRLHPLCHHLLHHWGSYFINKWSLIYFQHCKRCPLYHLCHHLCHSQDLITPWPLMNVNVVNIALPAICNVTTFVFDSNCNISAVFIIIYFL